MKEIDDNSVDLIITDPPYGISQNIIISRKNSKNINLDFGEWDHYSSDEEFENFTREWMSIAYNKLKEGGWFIVFFDKMRLYVLEKVAKEIGITPKNIFVWAKTNPVPHFRSMNFVSATELAWMGTKGNSKMKNYQKQTDMYNYILYPNKAIYGETEHPTEKPVEVFKRLIIPTTLENDIVMDPFMGSGTTAVSCILTKRHYIGFEINSDYVRMAEDRLKKYRYAESISSLLKDD